VVFTPLEKITLGRKYSISSWVQAGYMALVMKRDISDSEMEVVGAVESFKLMRIIKDISKSSFDFLALRGMIKKTFEAELQLIAATEGLYT
jgi:hypothetical protein